MQRRKGQKTVKHDTSRELAKWRERHQQLDDQVKTISRQKWRPSGLVKTLKRRRLQAKDAVVALEAVI